MTFAEACHLLAGWLFGVSFACLLMAGAVWLWVLRPLAPLVRRASAERADAGYRTAAPLPVEPRPTTIDRLARWVGPSTSEAPIVVIVTLHALAGTFGCSLAARDGATAPILVALLICVVALTWLSARCRRLS